MSVKSLSLFTERLTAACLSAAGILAPNIETALDLLCYPRRLIATFRS
jgi:hypothetical protein